MTQLTPEVLEIQDQNHTINEEYKVWKKNAPALYDFFTTKTSSWPNITVQWFPDFKDLENNMTELRFLAGTNTSDKAEEYLLFGTVQKPNQYSGKQFDPKLLNTESGEFGGHGASKAFIGIQTTQKILHDGAVNKARYMPQNPNIIATQGQAGRCLVFDRTKHTNEPQNDEINAQMVLVGHTDEGFGLDWSSHQEGLIASGCQDNVVQIWDIKNGFSKSNSQEYPAYKEITSHTNFVNDLQFFPASPFILATASEDNTAKVHDLRQNTVACNIDLPTAANCLTWHPDPSLQPYEHLLLIGGADGKIHAYDIRRPRKFHEFDHHKDGVVKIQWLPHDVNKFSSASEDRMVNIWDVTNIGKEQEQEDAEDGPPELSFMGGGFLDKVADFDIHPQELNLHIVVSEDHQTMIYQPQTKLIYPELELENDIVMEDLSD